VQFFAATTLHLKISKQWYEVPEVEYLQLREHLLANMRRPNIPIFILAKLCQAVKHIFFCIMLTRIIKQIINIYTLIINNHMNVY